MLPRAPRSKRRSLADVVQELTLRDPEWMQHWKKLLEWRIREMNQAGILSRAKDHAS